MYMYVHVHMYDVLALVNNLNLICSVSTLPCPVTLDTLQMSMYVEKMHVI